MKWQTEERLESSVPNIFGISPVTCSFYTAIGFKKKKKRKQKKALLPLEFPFKV